MWLDNLKELKSNARMSSKQIAERTNLPERTVSRIFSGDSPTPYVDTLYRIVNVLGGSLDDILADSKTVVGNKNLAVMQEDLEILNAKLSMLEAEKAMLETKVASLTAENDLLRLKLEHKEEIIALHNYYKTLMSGMTK